MAGSAVSIAASRVLNLSNSSLRCLIHRHLLRPGAAASTAHVINTNTTLPEQEMFNPFYSGKLNPDFVNDSVDAKNLNTSAATLRQNLQDSLGFSALKIEAARQRKDDYMDDDDDDSDYTDDDDEAEDYLDKDEDNFEDEDDDDDENDAPPRRRSRK